MKLTDNIYKYNEDVIQLYDTWKSPTVIISDGPYGIGGFPGDPITHDVLEKWYRPHITKWSEKATPETTLWFWNTEIGWASVHKEIINQGWEFVNCHVWDKGVAHIAGNTNTKTLRKFPVVTEVCVQYVKKAEFIVDNHKISMQEWLRHEWKRTGLPFSKTNIACGVKNAATRKYFTGCHLWYYPPVDAFEKIVEYANLYGDPKGVPYFSIDGKKSLTAAEWKKKRAKFFCEFGVNNVWREPPLNGSERLKEGNKAIHFNQKPLKFMELIINSSSEEHDVIWEPFGGLFSGILAANKLNRMAYGAEINKDVFDYAKQRLLESI